MKNFLPVKYSISRNLFSASFDESIIGALSNAPLPGVSVGVVKDGQDIDFRSYGVSRYDSENFEMSRPVNETTVFPIGDLSKSFTGLSVMQLFRDGKVDLDAPFQTYLPTVKISSSKPVTIRHLLSHTSGLKEFRGISDIVGLIWGSKVPSGQLKEYYEKSPMSSAGIPGEIYLKSHHNFGLLTVLVQELSNLEIREYFQRNIFNPLDMKQTDLILQDQMRNNLSDAFKMGGSGAKLLKQAVSGPVKSAQGGYSCMEDLCKFIGALADPVKYGKGVVDEKMLDEMFKPAYRVDSSLPGQALSLNVQQVCWTPSASDSSKTPMEEEVGYLTAGQGMSWAGFQAAFVVSRKLKTGVAVLSNCGTHNYEVSAITSKVMKDAVSHWKMEGPKNSDEKVTAVQKALGAGGFDQAALWPKLCGFYQLPLNQLSSARLMWLLGGELQVYQVRGEKLEIRAIFGPLSTNLFRTGKGIHISPQNAKNPFNYMINTPNVIFSTPVRGTSELFFDVEKDLLYLGMITLHKRPAYMSLWYPLMAVVGFAGYKMIGKARAFDILSQATLLAPP